MSSFKKRILSGVIWSGGGQIVTVIINLVTNVVLARLLSPKDFGKVGIIMFFTMIANVLTQGGLAGALVRQKEPEKSDFSTVFVFNLVVSTILAIALCLASGNIAHYYNEPSIQPLLIVAASILIITSFQFVQNLKQVVELRFDRKASITFGSTVIGSITSITLAFLKFGVWALVALPLATNIALTILLWISEGFYFSLSFNKKRFLILYKFGINTTVVSILNTGFDNIYQLILGKMFSLSQVGLFYQAKRLQDVPTNFINTISQGILFSGLAKLQDDSTRFLKVYHKVVLMFTATIGLITILIYLYAYNIVVLLYGKRWFDSGFYMQLLTISSFFFIQEMINKIVFKVFDRTWRLLQIEIMKKAIQVLSILVGIYYKSVEVLIIGYVITYIISYFINYSFARKIVTSTNLYELKVILKVIAISVGIVGLSKLAIWALALSFNYTLIMAPGVICLYVFCLYIFKIMNPITEIRNMRKGI